MNIRWTEVSHCMEDKLQVYSTASKSDKWLTPDEVGGGVQGSWKLAMFSRATQTVLQGSLVKARWNGFHNITVTFSITV